MMRCISILPYTSTALRCMCRNTQTKEGEAAYLGNILLFTLFTFFVTILMNIKKRLDE